MNRRIGRILVIVGVAMLMVVTASRLIGGGRAGGPGRMRDVAAQRGGPRQQSFQAPQESAQAAPQRERHERGPHHGGGRGDDRGGLWLGGLLRGALPIGLLGLLLLWPRLKGQGFGSGRGWRSYAPEGRGSADHDECDCPCHRRGRTRSGRRDPWDNELL